MANANGLKTPYYNISTLSSSDLAGYTGLNEVTASVDTQLNAYFSGMIVLYTGASQPAGWTNVNTTLVNAGAPSVTGYIWIKKN